ncbi:MAG: SAM-dependent methyltransferase [Chitinophagales bacterium]
MEITVRPIAFVKNERREVIDDDWGDIVSEIELTTEIIPEAFEGITDFSHVVIIFYMNKVLPEKTTILYRHPRNDPKFPKLGTYAQRHKNRPNQLGLTTVELLERKGKSIFVKGLDAIHSTPVLDIKPIMVEFQPKGTIRQPEWTKEIMKDYWYTQP